MVNFFKWIKYCFVVTLLFSCKATKVTTNSDVDTSLSSKAIIKRHYENNLDFKTIRGRIKIDYTDGKSEMSHSVSFRMEKDKAIWISAAIGLVKAYITLDRVSFYNRIHNEYFDGDFSYLSNLLGTELDFEKVQNVLLGQALFDLRNEKYNSSFTASNFELQPKKGKDLFKILYMLEPKNFKMNTQQLTQPEKDRFLSINYNSYQKVDKWLLPNKVSIKAYDADRHNEIEITYKSMEFNRPMKFPYKIPSGFKEIVLE